MTSEFLWQRIACETCGSIGMAVWKAAAGPARPRAGDVIDVPEGFTFYDDGRVPAYFVCSSCKLPAAAATPEISPEPQKGPVIGP